MKAGAWLTEQQIVAKLGLDPERVVGSLREMFAWWLLSLCIPPLPTADIISTVEFNHDGEFLATGDKGGRVVIFQRDGTKMRVSGAGSFHLRI